MSYSADFRQQVLSYLAQGSTIEETSKVFSIGTTTLKRWKKLKKETGQVLGTGRPTGPYKIDHDELKAYLKKYPDAFLHEIASHFGVTSTGIFCALRRLKITRKKKSTLYAERCEVKRHLYLKKLENIPTKNLVYVDESGIDSFVSRGYGRNHRGQRVVGERPGRRFARESFVAGIKNKKVLAPICYQGTMDSCFFNFWLLNFLIPNISKGDVIVMDNAAFHKSEETRKIIANAGCQLLFLPPYSPDLNPIEKFWANIKTYIKSNISKFKRLDNAIDSAFKLDRLNYN